jgi:predicted RNA-binding protein with PUA-like domain
MNYWLVKQNPESYSYADLVKEKKTDWTGVRNYQARNFLREMKKGDKVLFYHSGAEKAIVAVAKVVAAAYPDPTAKDGDWVAVDIAPEKKLKTPVPLDQIKQDAALGEMKLLKQSRLSVVPVEKDEFNRIIELGK